MGIFKALTVVLCAALVAVSMLHLVLLLSDSADYRRWVYIQMALLLCGAWLLWHISRLRPAALAAFEALTVPVIYVNATHINYGHALSRWLIPLVLTCIYCAIAYGVLQRSRARATLHGT